MHKIETHKNIQFKNHRQVQDNRDMQHKCTERQIHFKIPELTYTEMNTGLPTTEMHKCEERQRQMKLFTHLFYKESEAERETDPEKHSLKHPDIET